MNILSEMESAGLGRALKDSRNKTHQARCHGHSGMHKQKGWDFCPFCGVKLEVNRHCADCGKDFYSAASFDKHTKLIPFGCPKCNSLRYFGHTKRVTCIDCGSTRALKHGRICQAKTEPTKGTTE